MKPRIGIRPTIDGRWGGVRESLEEKQWLWQWLQRNLLKVMCIIKTEHLLSV